MSNQTNIAIIGGSQAYTLLSRGSFDVSKIPTFETPFGSVDTLYKLNLADKELYFLSRHGNKGYEVSAPFVNYRANIYALKELGVNQIVAWTGPGAINTDYKIGSYVIINDVIDETRNRQGTFFRNKGHGFIRMAEPFCSTVRSSIEKALNNLELHYESQGVYVCTEGPRLETPSEIKKYELFGGDLVGMTLVPECFLAKELEICYAAIGYVTNYAEGVKDTQYDPDKLFGGLTSPQEFEEVKDAVNNFPMILEETVRQLLLIKPKCKCQRSMSRFKTEGRVEQDWHEWIGK